MVFASVSQLPRSGRCHPFAMKELLPSSPSISDFISTVGVFRRSAWNALGQDIGVSRCICIISPYSTFFRMGTDRSASQNWIRGIGRTEALKILQNVCFCYESVDSEHESEDLNDHFSAIYDDFSIHEARLDHDLKDAAWLRADAYSEQQPYTRYVDSFKKKFAEQEFAALKRRQSGQPGTYVCLVAVSKVLPKDAVDMTWQNGGKGSRVLGTLDFSLHHPSPGEAFGGRGLPYGYIANVCVDKSARKQGIASALIECAVKIGRGWGLNSIFVHTHATNEPAHQLYMKKGFKVLQSGPSEKIVDGNLLLRLLM